MNTPVTLPLWAFILIVLFAAVTFASHFLFPSVRWFFRRRAERVIARLNERLTRPIEPFKLAKRYDMIQRLIYDPEVSQAIAEHARKEGVPENVAFETAQRYAREIVPSFSAPAYFTFGTRLARWLTNALYRVRIGAFPREKLESIDPDAAVVFVMNHRSNMDYVLVTHLVSGTGALSYAVGEWARVWPLSSMIKMMGAYFIRRRSRGTLYRKVLARYVQMATRGGVAQALLAEGGLSLNGRVGEPKLGLLNYIVSDDATDRREVIFVPVALNYDRVLEDRFLIKADKSGKRSFRPPLGTIIGGLSGHLWDRITRRFPGFGVASVGFGEPLTLSEFRTQATGDLTQAVAAELMDRIRQVVPVLSMPLVADAVLHGASTVSEVETQVAAHMNSLSDRRMALPRRTADELVTDTLRRLAKREIIDMSKDGQLSIRADGRDVLSYYAGSIAHHLGRKSAE